MQENQNTEAAASATGTNGAGVAGTWKQVRGRLRALARLRRQQAMRARNLRLEYATPEQLAYADLLDVGIRIGLYLLAGTFILYVLGITPAKVPLSELPSYWSMPADRYSNLVGVGTGWDWLTLIGYGDYLNFLGIAFLSSLTIACYLRVIPFSLQRKDFASGAVLALEVILLSLAASGLLVTGH